MSDKFIDLTGIRCPMPIFKLNKVLGELQSVQIIEAIADDPAFKPDVEAFCEMRRHEIISFSQEGKVFNIKIRKK